MAAAGEVLWNYEESKEPMRKEVVRDLLVEVRLAVGDGQDPRHQHRGPERAGAPCRDQGQVERDVLPPDEAELRHVPGDWQSWHNKNKDKPW
jgi:hypothetical protein